MKAASRLWSGLGNTSSRSGAKDETIAQEIEQRRKGNETLYLAADAFWTSLGKRKPLPFDLDSDQLGSSSGALADVKPSASMLPIESLGVAMNVFGSQFAEGSTYGALLMSLGLAQHRIGALQESLAQDTARTILARLARSNAGIDSYRSAIKTLESASARLEAVQTRANKGKSRKEKEKKELEDELRGAKAAYDEAATDVEARIDAIQESEHDDFVALSEYLDAFLDYTSECCAVLQQVRDQSAPATRPALGNNRKSSSSLRSQRPLTADSSGTVSRPRADSTSTTASRQRTTSNNARTRTSSMLRRFSSNKPEKETPEMISPYAPELHGTTTGSSTSGSMSKATSSSESPDDEPDRSARPSSPSIARGGRLSSFGASVGSLGRTVSSAALSGGQAVANGAANAAAATQRSQNARPSMERSTSYGSVPSASPQSKPWGLLGRKKSMGFTPMSADLVRSREGSEAAGTAQYSEPVNQELLDGVKLHLTGDSQGVREVGHEHHEHSPPFKPVAPADASDLWISFPSNGGGDPSVSSLHGVDGVSHLHPDHLHTYSTGHSPFPSESLRPDHTGVSLAMSDGASDPFGVHAADDDSHNDAEETQGLTGGDGKRTRGPPVPSSSAFLRRTGAGPPPPPRTSRK